MPRIEEVQFVNWGSLRPDPVPLLTRGINVATGPNGSGKTSFLDGLKLLLGVTDFTAGRTPAKYIFDGGTEATPADTAYLRAVFANPVARNARHRVFAWAGQGCESAEHVTIACVVSGQERWYVALPGRESWGTGKASLAEDLRKVETLPRSRRLGPRKYDELLERAGVTKALRGVLALPQGATDRLVEERPTGMLLRLLELTGKQHTREEFRAQREKYAQAKEVHARTLYRYRSEQRNLELLQQKAVRYGEWKQKSIELQLHDEVLLPAADYRDLAESRDQLETEVGQRRKAVDDDEAELAVLAAELPALRQELDRLRKQNDARTDALATVRGQRSQLDRRLGHLEKEEEATSDALKEADRIGADISEEASEALLADANSQLQEAEREHHDVTARLGELEGEIALLGAGRPVPPAELQPFVAALAERGIAAEVVAEHIDLTENVSEVDGRAAEAALAESLWAVVVPAQLFDAAVKAAVEVGHRWPVAAAGQGRPKEILASVEHPVAFGAVLEELDLPMHTHGDGPVVTIDGVRRSRVLARLQAPEEPVLGRQARQRQLDGAQQEVQLVQARRGELERLVRDLREARRTAERRVEIVRRLPDLQRRAESLPDEIDDVRADLRRLADEEEGLDDERTAFSIRLGELQGEIARDEKRKDELERRIGGRRDQLRQFSTRLDAVQQRLDELTLTRDQEQALAEGRVLVTDVVQRDRDRLAAAVADFERFPADVRDELILHQCNEQAEIITQVDALVTGHAEELDEQQRLVDEAAQRYEEHIRIVVRLLNQEFARICEAAGAEGEIRVVPGDRPGEQGAEVRVAHQAGEQRRSYRDPAHSGGQRAKIAILILLAAMAVGGEADLLVMDEHIAHLDSTNIDHIAELMGSLREHVQFVLAMPTNAESLRLGWCDVQLAFLPRSPGEAYTPPVRILASTSTEELEQRFAVSQMSL